MLRIPFQFDQSDGFVTVKGTVELRGQDLVIETSRVFLQIVPYRQETFRIPADEIESIEVDPGLLKHRLVVRPFSAEWLDGFPGDPSDEISIPIARTHRDKAEALVREARLRNLPR